MQREQMSKGDLSRSPRRCCERFLLGDLGSFFLIAFLPWNMFKFPRHAERRIES